MKKLILAFACLFVVVPSQARTITVDDDGLADFNNIQAAINDANNWDTIEVQPGTYTGPGNRDIDFKGLDITVTSIDPNDLNIVTATVIDCNGTEAGHHRGFYFHSGEDNNSVLAGLTITNGYDSSGGAIYCANSSPRIIRCTLQGNHASSGGGIYYVDNWQVRPQLIKCIIQNNSAESGGGGIYSDWGSDTEISDCIITLNSAPYGGGIYMMPYGMESVPRIVTVSNSTINHNSATANGGGIYCNWKTTYLVMTNCIVSDNSAAGNGGGMFVDEFATAVTVERCTFAGNSGGENGGAIYYGHCEPYHTKMTMGNCIIWGHVGREIYIENEAIRPPERVRLAVSYSDIEGGLGGVGGKVDLEWGHGNIDSDPCFADPWNGDYHLKSEAGRWDPNTTSWVKDSVTSPAIDAGNPGCPLGNEPNDANNVRINLGAYGGTAEASRTPANWRSIADLTNDWLVDYNDLSIFVDYWLEASQCIPSDLERSQLVDFSDFSIFGREHAEVGQARCFPRLHWHYANWLTVGEPNCWCHPRQCHGDTDGQPEGDPKSGYYYVGNIDLAIVQAVWITAPPGCWPANHGDCPNYEPCADFDHDLDVDDNDVSILETWYKVKEPPDGSGVPADCLQY